MNSRRLSAIFLIVCMACGAASQFLMQRGQAQENQTTETGHRGRIVNRYEEVAVDGQKSQQMKQSQLQKRPAWVESALERSYQFLGQNRQNPNVRRVLSEQIADVRESLKLLSATQDDIGYTHLRMKQSHGGIPVYAGQLNTHLKDGEVDAISGRVFDEFPEEVTPAITEAQALAYAKQALNHTGNFAKEPTVELVVLPKFFIKEEASTGGVLTYHVELQVSGGASVPGHHQYFVDAQSGRIVRYINSLPTGTGYSLYSGTQQINTLRIDRPFGLSTLYSMIDQARGGLGAIDLGTNTPFVFKEDNDSWGNGLTNNRETVAVDAYWGAERSWDYYLNRFGQNGFDGLGSTLAVGVHDGGDPNNAHAGNPMAFGDGDGVTYRPFVSLDVVGHEFTHNVTASTAKLEYEKESGALNESFSDIFGTAIEFYASNQGNYLIGEQVTTNGLGLRSMADPPTNGNPDHYNNRSYKGACTPIGDSSDPNYNDLCGVHTNSGIQNKAFYLLAEGGMHLQSHVNVGSIGRLKAEKIFYRALTTYLFPTASFADARYWTIKAAADLFGHGSYEYTQTRLAWDAVGVKNKSCTYSLGAPQQQVSANGGLTSFQVNTQSECRPEVISNVSWIKIGYSFIISGSQPITFYVDANNQNSSRTGTISVEGQTFTVLQDACSMAFQPDLTSFTRLGGNGTITVTATGACGWTAASQADWLKIESGASGVGNGQVKFSVAPNINQVGRTGTIALSGKLITVSQGANSCTVTPIAFGQTVNGQLHISDCYSPLGPGVRYADRYLFSAPAGQPIAVSMNSTTVDSYLRLIGPTGTVLATSDDVLGTSNSRIPASHFFVLPAAGTYLIEATTSSKPSFSPNTGGYSLQLTTNCSYMLSQTNYNVRSGGGPGNFAVSTASYCPWTVSSSVTWISITQPGTVGTTGNGTVNFTVAANPSSQSRTGTITVAGKQFTVQQSGKL